MTEMGTQWVKWWGWGFQSGRWQTGRAQIGRTWTGRAWIGRVQPGRFYPRVQICKLEHYTGKPKLLKQRSSRVCLSERWQQELWADMHACWQAHLLIGVLADRHTWWSVHLLIGMLANRNDSIHRTLWRDDTSITDPNIAFWLPGRQHKCKMAIHGIN